MNDNEASAWNGVMGGGAQTAPTACDGAKQGPSIGATIGSVIGGGLAYGIGIFQGSHSAKQKR